MEPQPEQLLLAEMQVLLAEKRTYYALLRTGLTVITVPLSILAFLIVTAKFHSLFDHWWLATVVVAGLVLASFGGVVVFEQSQRKLHRLNKMIRQRERENQRIDEIII